MLSSKKTFIIIAVIILVIGLCILIFKLQLFNNLSISSPVQKTADISQPKNNPDENSKKIPHN